MILFKASLVASTAACWHKKGKAKPKLNILNQVSFIKSPDAALCRIISSKQLLTSELQVPTEIKPTAKDVIDKISLFAEVFNFLAGIESYSSDLNPSIEWFV